MTAPAAVVSPWQSRGRRGRRPIPDKVTSGIASNARYGWRYWTRVNGKTTWGPFRRTEIEARRDERKALAGCPPKKLRMGQAAKAARTLGGLCIDCDRAPVAGHRRCARHLKADRERQEKRRRAAGQRTRKDFEAALRDGTYVPKERVLTREVMEAKLAGAGRCPCGLLLPCYHPSVEDYASARPGGGNVV